MSVPEQFIPNQIFNSALGLITSDTDAAAVPREQMAPHFVMCPPNHYAVSYKINPWMDPASWAAKADTLTRNAQMEWQRLFDALRSLGGKIELMPAEPDLPDLVFTANCGFVLDRKVLAARYRYPQRRGEEVHGLTLFAKLQWAGIIDEVHQMPDPIYFEGAGDCLWDPCRRVVWCGWGPRSSPQAKAVLERIYHLPVVALELVDRRFYHLDTALCFLAGGDVLYVPSAFSAYGAAMIQDIAGKDNLIAVADSDAQMLAANCVSIGRHVVLATCGLGLEQQLKDRGYIVHYVPLDAFGRSGGSAACLTLRLNNMARTAANGRFA